MCGALIAFVVAKQRSRLKRQIWDSFVATFDFLVGHLVRLHDFPCSGLVEFQREKEIAAESGFCLPTHLRERSVNDKRASVDPSVWFDRVPEQPEPPAFFWTCLCVSIWRPLLQRRVSRFRLRRLAS